MTLDEIEQLVARLQQTSIDSVDLQLSDCSLKLRWPPTSITRSLPSSQPGESHPCAQTTTSIPSPRMGRFLDSHPLDNVDTTIHATPPTHVGRPVRVGDILGYVQADAVLVAVRAPQNGTVHQILVAPHEVVGYAQPLFSLTHPSQSE